MGLNNAQLEEYFITGKDPRLKDRQKKKLRMRTRIYVSCHKRNREDEPYWKRAIKHITRPNLMYQLKHQKCQQEVVKTAALPSNVNQNTGLTHVEEALLSNEEKAMRLRQKGMTA